MKNLDCNQIINLEIIGEEDKNKKNFYFFKKLTKFLQFDGEWENFNCVEIRFLIILGIIREEELT